MRNRLADKVGESGVVVFGEVKCAIGADKITHLLVLRAQNRSGRGNSSLPVVGARSRFGATDEINGGCMCTSAEGKSGGDALTSHGDGSDSHNWPEAFDPDIIPLADGPPTDGTPP